MAAASRDLQGLLAGLDPSADVARRHIWLIDLFDWLRGDRASPQAAMGRVQLLLDAIEAGVRSKVCIDTTVPPACSTARSSALPARSP
jgi:site-specific recombinase